MIKKATPTEIHSESGDLLRIEFHDQDGKHIIDAVWDDSDEQTTDKRKEFRLWTYKAVQNKGYLVELPS